MAAETPSSASKPSADDSKLNIWSWENPTICRAPHPDRNRIKRMRSLPSIGGRRTTAKLSRYPYARLHGPASTRLLHVSFVDRVNYIIYGWLQDLLSIEDAKGEYFALSYTWGSPLMKGFEPEERGRPRFRLILFPHGSEADSVTYPASHEMEFRTRVTAFTAHFELPLTQSLSDFFLTVDLDVSFAAVGKSLPLWIDALCINQQDAAEVNQQVLLMGDIYNLCRKTIVWLGPDAQDLGSIEWILGEAGEALMKLSQTGEGGGEAPDTSRPHWLSGKNIMDETFWHEVGVKIPPIEIHEKTQNLRPVAQQMMKRGAQTQERASLCLVWMAWCQFFESRSWFHRAWVMQEAASFGGAYIVAGTLHVAWERLFDMDRTLCWAGHYQTFIHILAPALGLEDTIHGPQYDMYLAWYRILYKLHFPEQVQKSIGEHGNSLFFSIMELLMRHSWKKKATVPRDKYACILGIAHQTMPRLEIPSNLIDWLVMPRGESASETFLHLHRVLICADRFRALKMLRLVHHASNAKMVGSPSWIVDWAAENVPDPLDYGRFRLLEAGIYAPQSPTLNVGRDEMIRVSVGGSSLRVEAVALSKVQSVFPTRVTATSHALSAVLEVLSLFGPTYAKTGEPLEAALFGAMTASNPPDGFDRSQLDIFCDLLANATIRGLSKLWADGLTAKRLVTTDGLYYWSFTLPGGSIAPPNLENEDFVGLHTFPQPITGRKRGASSLATSLLRAKKALSLAIAHLTGGTQRDEVGEIPGFTWSPPLSPQELTLQAYHRRVLPGRALLATDDGFLGLGPGIAQAGDELWLVSGRSSPCILRAVPEVRVNGGVGKYWFVGEAWVHGLMDGQGVTEGNKDSFTQIELV